MSVSNNTITSEDNAQVSLSSPQITSSEVKQPSVDVASSNSETTAPVYEQSSVDSSAAAAAAAVGTTTSSNKTYEVTSDVADSSVSDITTPVSEVEQVTTPEVKPSSSTDAAAADEVSVSQGTSPEVEPPSSASLIDENDYIQKLREELNNEQQIDDFACYELINKITKGQLIDKCKHINSLLLQNQSGGVQQISQQINTPNELEGYLKKDNIGIKQFLQNYDTIYDKANKQEYKNRTFYELTRENQAKVYKKIVEFLTTYNKQKTIDNLETETQRKNEQGAYAIYVKIKLITVEGDVDLDDAECQDRFIRIKTGFADIVNKLPLENIHIGKYIPDTIIKPKTARSDTAKLSNNKTVKFKPPDKSPEKPPEKPPGQEPLTSTLPNNYNRI